MLDLEKIANTNCKKNSLVSPELILAQHEQYGPAAGHDERVARRGVGGVRSVENERQRLSALQRKYKVRKLDGWLPADDACAPCRMMAGWVGVTLVNFIGGPAEKEMKVGGNWI